MRLRPAILALCAAIATLAASCERGGSGTPAWDEATLASCWDGPNAERRMMNILSPLMPDEVFRERVEWMVGRGCNTAHVFLVNAENGDYAGYSPWGVGRGPCLDPVDGEVCTWMRRRINRLRSAGLAVVVWVMSDDSATWARDLALMAPDCIAAIANAGLFDEASTVVAGLEMDEYWGAREAAAVIGAIRRIYGGKVGVHHTGGRAPFAGLGDIIFYQTAPGRSAAQISADSRAALSHGRPVCFFELDRHANRELCEDALAAGCYGVGNW